MNNISTVASKRITDNAHASTSFYTPGANDPLYNGYMIVNSNYELSKTLAESMSEAYSYPSNVKTGMINNTQWDSACRWIYTRDYVAYPSYQGNIWGNYSDSVNPANGGNYSSGTLRGTGSNENWKAGNIYDIAGNLREWTSEIYQGNQYTFRDVAYSQSGVYGGPSLISTTPSYAFNDMGIRTVLYIE